MTPRMNQRPSSIPHAMAQAVAFNRAGRVHEAAAVLQHILSAAPAHPEALNLLGSIALRAGQLEPAIQVLTRAAAAAPRAAEPRINLGHALKAAERIPEALDAYREAVRLKPRDPQGRYALGNGFIAAGDMVAAERELREAIRLFPRFGDAHNNLGHVLRALGRPGDAEAEFTRALKIDPSQTNWMLNLALAQGEQKRADDAMDTLRRVLRQAPDRMEALHALGILMVRAQRFEEAIPPLQRLRTLQKDTPDPFSGLAQALTALGRFDEARQVAEDTVRLEPESAGARSNLAAILLAQGRLTEAEALYDLALSMDPEHALARTGRGFVRLMSGRLEQGWDDYEARLDAHKMESDLVFGGLIDSAKLSGAAWSGEPRNGRTLLVYPEQGLGDAIQMVRYAPLLAADGPVIWAVPPALRRMFATVPGVTRIAGPDDAIPDHVYHCSIMGLPRLFRTSLATIPASIPYMSADPGLAEAWRERLAGYTGRKIGLVWQGNPEYLADRVRSVDPALLTLLAGVRDVTFVSLQLPRPAVPPPLPMADLTAEIRDFADTAALMEALDLIVAVDTSVAHLAGALGRPVWLLNRFNTDWRWLRDRADSPWYPTMRIFRQPAPRDWESVLIAVRDALNNEGGAGR